MFVIISNSIRAALRCVGPFSSHDDAQMWGKSHMVGACWHVSEVQMPVQSELGVHPPHTTLASGWLPTQH